MRNDDTEGNLRTDEGNEELFAAAEFQLAVIIFRENIMNVWNSKVGSGKQNAAPPLGSADEFFCCINSEAGNGRNTSKKTTRTTTPLEREWEMFAK